MSVPFVSGLEGYDKYRIPSLVKTPDGILTALCEGRVDGPSDTGNIDIVAKQSLDMGESWSPIYTVTSHASNTAGNPCTVVDPASGDIVLLSCRNGQNDTSEQIRTGVAPARRVYVQRSSDSGATWTSPSEITAQVRPSWMRWFATGPGHGTALSTGRLVIPCNHSREPSGTDTGAEPKYSGGHCIYSDDGGTAWSLGFQSSSTNGFVNEDEATVCTLDDGTLYFNCRCEESDERTGNRADLYSTDGETSESFYLPQGCLITPAVQGSVINTPYGLVFSCCSHPDGRTALALWTSEDDGATWYLKKYVTGRVSGYSDMTLLDYQTIGILYESGDLSNYQRIEFTTVPLSELF